MPIPVWLDLDPAVLREESGLLPHQLEASSGPAWMEATIEGHITTQAEFVLAEAQVAASAALSFPSTDAQLKSACPVRLEWRVVTASDAGPAEIRGALAAAKAAAKALTWPRPLSPTFEVIKSDFETQVNLTQADVDAAATQATSDRTARIERQQELVRSCVTSLVYAKLWYSIAGDDYQATAKGHWVTAQSLLGSIRTEAMDVFSNYRLNTQSAFI